MYCEHFGFREPPFNVTPDPRFFYKHPSHQEALATVRYGIEARKGFIVITGEAGTGKTVLLRMLMRGLNPNVRTAFVLTSTRVSFPELLRTVLHDLGLNRLGYDRSSLTAQLNDLLLQELKERRIVSLLIDEAQDLSHEMLEEIRLLSNFETDSAKLLQIVLVGQPGLDSKLDGPELWQLKQRVMLRRRLTALSSAEVGPYIDCRLHIAGYAGKPLFESRAIRQIAAYTGGIPRVINVICDNALERAWQAKTRVVSTEIVDQVARHLQLHDRAQTQLESASLRFSGDKGEEDPNHDAQAEDRALTRDIARSLSLNHSASSHRSLAPKARPWIGVVTLLSMMIVTAATLLMYSHQSTRLHSQAPFTRERNTGDLSQSLDPDTLSMAATNAAQNDERFRREPLSHRDSLHDSRVTKPRQTASREIDKNAQDEPRHAGTSARMNHLRQTTRSADAVIHWVESEPVWSASETIWAEFQSPETRQATAEREAYFEVMTVSPIRNSPRSGSEILANLQPGTWVKLIAEHGDYWEIQSLNNSEMRGYVQREHGVFEPLRATLPPKDGQPISPTPKPSSPERRIVEAAERTHSRETYFEVMAVSVLRNRPQPEGEIVATLPPGTWVQLIGERGDYLHIQSLNDSHIRGYVQREHGVFEPLRATLPPQKW